MSSFKGNGCLATKNNDNREFCMPCFCVNKESKEVADVSVQAMTALSIECLTKCGKKKNLVAPVHFRGRSKHLSMDQAQHLQCQLKEQPVVESVTVERETPHLMKVQAKQGGCITLLLVDLVSSFCVTEGLEEAVVSEETAVASRPKKRFKRAIIAAKNRARLAMGCPEDKLLEHKGVVVLTESDDEVEAAVAAAALEEEPVAALEVQPAAAPESVVEDPAPPVEEEEEEPAAVPESVVEDPAPPVEEEQPAAAPESVVEVEEEPVANDEVLPVTLLEEEPLDEVAPEEPELSPQPLEHPEGYIRFTSPPTKK